MEVDKRFAEYFNNLKQVFLYITDECNLHCEQCLYKPSVIQKKKIQPETAKQLLCVAKELGAFKLSVLGGELTLYDTDSLKDILYYSKMVLGYEYIRIVTNGIFNKDLFTSRLFEYVDEVSFSLDGYDEITHESLRNKSTFRKTINNLRYATNSNLMVHITSCVTKQNTEIAGGVEKYISNMIRFAEKEGAHTINFHGVFEMGTPMDAWTHESHLMPQKYYEGVKNIFKKIKNNEYEINIRLPLHIIKKEEFNSNINYYSSYCPSKLGERILIHPNGMIRICSSLLSSDYGVAYFDKDKIVWKLFNNELDKVDCSNKTPCCQQTRLYSNDFVPVCFSFKPNQEEIVWNKLKNEGLGINFEDIDNTISKNKLLLYEQY